MAKSYSDKYLLSLANLNPKRLGVQLGKVCVEANLPPNLVANTLGVHRMSVYYWFRGKAINDRNANKVENFIEKVKSDLEHGKLPVPNTIDAKKYLEAIHIDKI